MENIDTLIKRHALVVGMSVDEVKELVDTFSSYIRYSEAEKVVSSELKEKLSVLKDSCKSKRRKPTNYTRPRSRKKKSKY